MIMKEPVRKEGFFYGKKVDRKPYLGQKKGKRLATFPNVFRAEVRNLRFRSKNK